MNKRSTLVKIALVSAGLTALVACGNNARPDAAPAVAPATVVQTVTVPAPQPGQPAATEPAPVQQQPQVPQQAPVLQRTQGAVQIFKGPAPAPIDPPADVTKSSPAVQLDSGQSPVVTDSRGMTLYRFDEDTANPSKATCAGACAEKWPPLLVKSPGKIYTVGVDPSLVGYVERPDGTCQVTVGGWPAYYFFKDKKPGDILGQGVGNTWFALNSQGGKAAVANTGSGS
jgi:predicted lipoprotein with Yx(FWY)xxD motif